MTTKYFNIALYIFFGIAIIIAVALFSGKTDFGNKKSDTEAAGTVSLWGTIPSSVISSALSTYNNDHQDYGVSYRYIEPSTYEDELIEAFASGKGPDMYMVTPGLLTRFSDKISPIPYTSFTERSYTDSFVTAANIFLTEQGILALPFRSDPLVMYYNRDILESSFQLTPPRYWDDMYAFAQSVTKKSADGIISESAIAFGAWDNVTHAKDIVAMMLLQSGNAVTERSGSSLVSVLDKPTASGNSTARSLVTFYGEFANPSSLYYSWNEAKPESFDAFVAGDLALYFGYASELPTILAKNPNLNFDVAIVPQIKNIATQKTYVDLVGIAISKFSKNPITAYVVASEMTGKDFSETLAEGGDVTPSVRRDMLKTATTVDDAYRAVFNNSAIIGATWIDPDSQGTESIFRTMIKSYTSGAASANDAVRSAHSALDLLIKS